MFVIAILSKTAVFLLQVVQYCRFSWQYDTFFLQYENISRLHPLIHGLVFPGCFVVLVYTFIFWSNIALQLRVLHSILVVSTRVLHSFSQKQKSIKTLIRSIAHIFTFSNPILHLRYAILRVFMSMMSSFCSMRTKFMMLLHKRVQYRTYLSQYRSPKSISTSQCYDIDVQYSVIS